MNEQIELTADIANELELKEESVKKINTFFSDIFKEKIQEETKEVKASASKNAEKIIDDIVSSTEQKIGVKKNDGEKHADYLKRVNLEVADNLSKQRKEVDDQKKDLEKKIKEGAGNDTFVKEFDELKGKYSTLQAKEADFDKLIGSGIVDEHKELVTNHTLLKSKVAFQSGVPGDLPKINEFERLERFRRAEQDINTRFNIEEKDGKLIYSDKLNEYKKHEPIDLIKNHEEIKAIYKQESNKTNGVSTTGQPTVAITGLSEPVPLKATNEIISELAEKKTISDSEGAINRAHPSYAPTFKKNHKLIKNASWGIKEKKQETA